MQQHQKQQQLQQVVIRKTVFRDILIVSFQPLHFYVSFPTKNKLFNIIRLITVHYILLNTKSALTSTTIANQCPDCMYFANKSVDWTTLNSNWWNPGSTGKCPTGSTKLQTFTAKYGATCCCAISEFWTNLLSNTPHGIYPQLEQVRIIFLKLTKFLTNDTKEIGSILWKLIGSILSWKFYNSENFWSWNF